MIRSLPIPPIPRPTTCTLLTARDPAEPLCSESNLYAKCHRLAMFPTDSRIAAIPSIWLFKGGLPRTRHRSIPDTADHLEIAAALLLTIWLIILSTNVGAPTTPFSRLPWPKLSRLYQATKGNSRPAFQFTHQRSLANDDFSVFPQPQQTHGLSLPTQLFSYPPVNRIQTTNGPSAFLDDTTTDDLPNHGSPALARRCFRLHRLSHIHLGSPPRRSIPQWVICFYAVRVHLFQPSTGSVSVAREHRTVLLQPNGPESPSVPENTSATPIPPPPYPNISIGLPSEPVVLFLPGYDISEPGIRLGGLVPQSLTTHHHILPLLFSKLELIIFPGISVSNRVSVWVGSLPLFSAPPLPFHCSPFSEFFFLFLGLLNLPSLIRMGPFSPEIGPFHGLSHVERCEHPIPGIVLGGLVPPLLRPTYHHPPPSTDNAKNRAPPVLGTDLGGLDPPSFLPHAPPIFAEDTFRTSRLRTIPKHHRPPSPPQNRCSVYFGPRHRLSFASQLRERRRGRWRSSWIGFQAVLRSPQRPPLMHPF